MRTSLSATALGKGAPVTQAFVGSSRSEAVAGGELQTRMAVSTLKSAGKAAVVIREQTRLTAPTYYAEQAAGEGGAGSSEPGRIAVPDRWDPDIVGCDAPAAGGKGGGSSQVLLVASGWRC
jgi:hypothetical protein